MNFFYRIVVWRYDRCANFLGLYYIPKLRRLLKKVLKKKKADIYEMKALWDSAFFTVLDHNLREHILFLNSRAHSWGVIGFGTVLVLVWYLFASFLVPLHSHWIIAASVA